MIGYIVQRAERTETFQARESGLRENKAPGRPSIPLSARNRFRRAEKMLERGQFKQALEAANQLVDDGDETRYAGYLYRGWIYELGGDGVNIDLDRAISNYRQAAVEVPCAPAYQNLARVLMKRSVSDYHAAFFYLEEGYALRRTPDLELGFAHYYQNRPDSDPETARKFYLKAAIHGRRAGVLGYCQSSFDSGGYLKAFFAAFVGFLAAPVFFLVAGSSANDPF